MSGERPITYLNARPDASGYRSGNPVPMANGRHTFYHVIITDEQRTAVDASLRKLGISFGREQTPMKFDIAQKTIANMRSQFNRETSDHGNTRKLRQMEKETLEGIYDTCMYKMANLEKSAQRESPEDPSAYMAEHNLYASFLRSTMNAIEGVQNKVRQEQEQYMKNKRQAIDEEKRRMYLREGRRYTTVATTQPAATATATVIVKPKDEGAINVLDLLGGEDDDGEKTDDTKDLPLLEGEHLAEGEEESPTTSAQKNFQEALARNHQSGESDDGGADDDGLTAPQLEKFIDDDLKPPKLELDGEEAGEELPPPIRIPFLTRRPINGEPLMKRPRILGHNGVTYKVVQPTGRFVPRGAVKIREQGEGRMTVAEMGMNKVHSINTIAGLPVTLRPTSSTVLPADVRDKLIADGLTKHQTGAMKPVVQRVNSIVYRKDYKNPPTPLPADDGTHVLCHLCDNRIMCTRLSNLTNHVRRHSAAKQYQCAHCTYQHNEQAKVRLHMTNNHDDETSQPVDNLTKDMQKVWEYLMDECFPGYLEQLKQAQPHSSVNWDRAGGSRGSRGETGPTTLEELHTCSECGSAISVNAHQQNSMMITEPLVEHLMTEHRELCIAHVCGECDYANADEWKVRWHISTRHEKGASDIPVNTAPEGEHIDLFLYKFFPSIENVLGPRDDPEESELKDAMGGNDPNTPTTAAIPARPSRISPGPSGLICKEEANSEDEEALDKSFLKSRFPQPGKIDVSKLGEKEVLCELCNKILIWENKNTLCTLLAHAKRHFKIKQFQCQICSYASSESQHVKQHMLQRHNEVARPKEHNNEFMQNSWLSVMRKCFPLLRERIDNFKFKTAKSLARQEREEKEREKMGDRRERTPPRHGYGTRRKRTLQEK